MNSAIGIDVGGTKIAFGLISEGGKVLKKIIKKSEPHDLERFKKVLQDGIKEVDGGTKIGIAVAGQVDVEKKMSIWSPNIPCLTNVVYSDFIGGEVRVANDANLFALAESKFGAGRDLKYMVGITLGTGIGSGIVIDGKMYHGQGFAPEVGHIFVRGEAECSCGEVGHLEAYSSGTAIQRAYKDKTGQSKMALEIEAEALKDTNSLACQIYVEAAESLGMGLVNVINIFDPEIIVLGGTMAKAKLLVEPAIEFAHGHVFFKGRKTKIVRSELRNEAGLIGAAALFFE